LNGQRQTVWELWEFRNLVLTPAPQLTRTKRWKVLKGGVQGCVLDLLEFL